MDQRHEYVPFSFDLSMLVQRSVASLYSHLVTRPTGRALRLGIESQIGDLHSACVSVLDFTQVVVLDYSCADEAVAKLLQRFHAADRPAEAYFIARGLGVQHRDPIETVLERHGLTLVAEIHEAGFGLLGVIDGIEREAWDVVEELGQTTGATLAERLRVDGAAADAALRALAARRVVLASRGGAQVRSLSSLLRDA